MHYALYIYFVVPNFKRQSLGVQSFDNTNINEGESREFQL
jgi:hypothetical protein